MKLSLRIDVDIKTKGDYLALYEKMQRFCAKTSDQLGIPYHEYVNLMYDFSLFAMACGLEDTCFKSDRKRAVRNLSKQFTEEFIEKTKSVL